MTIGIQVIHLTGYNPDTQQEEIIRVCDSPDFIANGASYVNILAGKFDFSSDLFSRGTTSGQVEVGLGDIILNCPRGELDKYRKYGFDGRTVQIYQPSSRADRYTNDTNLYFTGVIAHANIGWNTATFTLKGAMEALNVPMQSNGYLGTNLGTGGTGGYEGSTDLLGVAKPQVFGRCLSVAGVPVNEFYLVYAFNYDSVGTPKPLYQVYSVFVKGVRYIYGGTDYATPTLMIAANLTGLGAGKYVTCLSYGMIRLSSTPASNGKVVADIADANDTQCTAAQTVYRVLTQNAALPASKFNTGELSALDLVNTCPVGIAINDSSVTIADAVNQLLDSIRGWMIEDNKGIFRFGYMDLTDNLVAAGNDPVCTITRDWWDDSIERVPLDDQNENIPVSTVELKHTKNWSVQDSGSLADSVSLPNRTFFTTEFRSARSSNGSVPLAHLLAGTLVQESLLNSQLYLSVLNGDFSTDIAVGGNGWTLGGTGATYSLLNSVVTLIPNGSFFAKITQTLAILDAVYASNNYEVVFTVPAGQSVILTVARGIGLTTITTATFSAIAKDTTFTVPFTVPPNSTTSAWNISLIFSSPTIALSGKVGNVYVRVVQQGLSPQEEVNKRKDIQSGFSERYVFDVPLEFAQKYNLRPGMIVTMQDNERFGMQNGLNFQLLGVATQSDDIKVQLNVVRIEYFSLSSLS